MKSSVTVQPTPTTGAMAKLAVGVGLGSFIEYYDFFIAAVASAIIWPAVFFSWASGPIAYALSLVSFGMVYFTRPIGAYVFGHFGDKLGRRSLMLVTFSVMGISLLGIGLDPSFASIGITSVVALFVFRALFGLGLGGEFGGGVSWLVEFAAKSKWRAFWTLWAQPSTIGSAVSSFSFSLIAAFYGKNFLTFGWRIPFFIASLLIVVGIIIRYSLQESPLFKNLQEKREIESRPASQALKENWKGILLLGGTLLFIVTPGGALQAIYGTSYLVARGMTASFATFSAAVGAAVGSIFLIVGALSGDIIGRKKTFLTSSIIMIVALVVYMPLLGTLNPSLIISAQIFEQSAAGIGIPMTSVIFAEYFATRYRYSASGMSFQFGNLFFGIIITFILPASIALGGGVLTSAPTVTALMVASAVISLICIIFVRETKGDKMAM